MTEQDFEKLVEDRNLKIENTLILKGKEYRRNNNPMHNFDRASIILGTTREKALLGFMTKHLVSFMDMLDDIEKGYLPTVEAVDEKLGDIINYFVLAEASIKDKIKENVKQKTYSTTSEDILIESR